MKLMIQKIVTKKKEKKKRFRNWFKAIQRNVDRNNENLSLHQQNISSEWEWEQEIQ